MAQGTAAGSDTLGAIFSLHRDQLERLASPTPGRVRPLKSLTVRTAKQRLPTLGGKYLIRESIGKGAFGHVYRALDRSTGREVALKLLQSRHAFSSTVAARFLREGRTLQKLDHRGVVRIFELIRKERALGLAMEFVRGRTLEQRVAQGGALDILDATRIGRQICSALREVHRAGFIHRDIKAENIIERPDGQVVLLDFGITRGVNDGAQITADGVLVGTPLSMAPEQHELRPVDDRTDLYSVGCLLYLLLSGRHPVEGFSLTELRRRVLEGDYPRVEERRPAVPAELAAVVARSMAREPDDRYQSAREMEEALQTVLALL